MANTIIISADYFGKAILSVQRMDNISKHNMMHLFGCSALQLHRYIYGIDLIPFDTLQRIFNYAAMMDRAIAADAHGCE